MWQNSYNLNSSNMNDDLQQLFFCLCCVVIFNIIGGEEILLGGKFVGGETP